MAWVRTRRCKLQKKVHSTPGTPASSTTKTGRHDKAEILLKVALDTINQSINQSFGFGPTLIRVYGRHRKKIEKSSQK